MKKHNLPGVRPLLIGAAVFILVSIVTFSLLRAPRVFAQPRAQATATVNASATITATVPATFTNACGVVISNVIMPTAPITATVAPIPTDAPTPTATATPATPISPTVRVLRIGEDVYPAVLDPQRAAFVNEFEILSLAYEGLVSLNAKGQVEPAAAEKYEFNADRSQLIFWLRPNLKRVDGTPITSKDFAAALQRALDPCLGGREYASVLFDIAGARELSEFDIDEKTPADLQAAKDAIGIDTPDDKTLILSFNEPVGQHWLYIASLPVFYPTDAKLTVQSPNNWAQVAGNHNGNGPFVIITTDGAYYITLAPNPNYWRGAPKLDRIEFSYNPDNQAQLDAYKKGELDIDAAVTAELVPQILSDTLKNEFHNYDSAQTFALAFNNSVKPFDDRIVRIAFSQAVNREGFVKDVLGGQAQVTTRWIPEGVPGNQADKPGVPASDPKAAVKTLVENGYGTADGKVDCAKLGAIKFTYPDSPVNKARVDYLANNLTNVIGCPVTPEAVDAMEFTQLTRNVETNPQLSLQRWVEDYPHPQNWLSAYWTCGSLAQLFGYCNLFLDDLLHQADTTTDLEKSIKLYQQAEDLMISDVPGAFLYNPLNLQLVKPYVQGPAENTSPRDAGWIGQYGPVWNYNIDLNAVPSSYPRQ